MTDEQKILLDSIQDMAEQAPKVGLCSMPFRIMYDRVSEIIAENTHLKSECDRLLSIR